MWSFYATLHQLSTISPLFTTSLFCIRMCPLQIVFDSDHWDTFIISTIKEITKGQYIESCWCILGLCWKRDLLLSDSCSTAYNKQYKNYFFTSPFSQPEYVFESNIKHWRHYEAWHNQKDHPRTMDACLCVWCKKCQYHIYIIEKLVKNTMRVGCDRYNSNVWLMLSVHL